MKNQEQTTVLKNETQMAVEIFSFIARGIGAKIKEPLTYLPLDYTFRNPDVSYVLEKLHSCDKYAVIYSYHCMHGLNKQVLSEGDVPVRMIDIIKEFFNNQNDISHVAVLKETHFRDTSVNYELLIYHFNKDKYESYLKELFIN